MEINIFQFDPSFITHALRHLLICVSLWILMLAAILLDLWDGLYTARKTGKRIKSHILRITIAKVGEYWRFMLIAFVIDSAGTVFPFYNFPYISIVFFLGLVGVEVKSMLEHAKRRKSHIDEAATIVQRIIECATDGTAKEIIDTIINAQKSHLEKEDGTI